MLRLTRPALVHAIATAAIAAASAQAQAPVSSEAPCGAPDAVAAAALGSFAGRTPAVAGYAMVGMAGGLALGRAWTYQPLYGERDRRDDFQLMGVATIIATELVAARPVAVDATAERPVAGCDDAVRAAYRDAYTATVARRRVRAAAYGAGVGIVVSATWHTLFPRRGY